MAKQVLNVGSIKNDGTGDSLRDGAKKINDNFTELYNALGATTGQLSLVSRLTAGDGITVSSPSGAVIVTANIATTTKLGSIIVGENLTIDNDGVLSANAGGYTLPVAQRGTLGGIKVGDTLQISETGVVNVIDDLYTLPIATSQILGGIKVGARLTITNGVLSADVQSIPTATTSVKGGVVVDGITIGINGSGVISVIGSGNSLRNGDSSFTLESNGTLMLNGEPFTTSADTGNITFTNSDISSTTGYFRLTGGEDATIEIPQAGSGNSVLIYANTSNPWTFAADGSLRTPNSTIYTDQNSGTLLVANTPTLVFTSANAPWVGGVKLLLIAQGSLTGQSTSDNGDQWHTQMAEALIANRAWDNPSEPIMSVYGVTYTSTSAFVTYSVQKNPSTSAIEVYATTAESTYSIRVRANATHVNAF